MFNAVCNFVMMTKNISHDDIKLVKLYDKSANVFEVSADLSQGWGAIDLLFVQLIDNDFHYVQPVRVVKTEWMDAA